MNWRGSTKRKKSSCASEVQKESPIHTKLENIQEEGALIDIQGRESERANV